ncbi:MAG: hypothetical protein K6B46_02990 [Opitutales bacterium]|nr:hypothetical protein [Opitutales bacterium]
MYRLFAFYYWQAEWWYKEKSWNWGSLTFGSKGRQISEEESSKEREKLINQIIYYVFCYWYDSRFMGRLKCPLLEVAGYSALSSKVQKEGLSITNDLEFYNMVKNALADPLKYASYDVPDYWEISTMEEYQKLLPQFWAFIEEEKDLKSYEKTKNLEGVAENN